MRKGGGGETRRDYTRARAASSVSLRALPLCDPVFSVSLCIRAQSVEKSRRDFRGAPFSLSTSALPRPRMERTEDGYKSRCFESESFGRDTPGAVAFFDEKTFLETSFSEDHVKNFMSRGISTRRTVVKSSKG